MIAPSTDFQSCVGDMCGNDKIESKNWNARAIKLNASDFVALGATIKEISKSICAASDNISSYTVSLSISGGAVFINGASGIAVEVECK